jgi:hypothetical protein
MATAVVYLEDIEFPIAENVKRLLERFRNQQN